MPGACGDGLTYGPITRLPSSVGGASDFYGCYKYSQISEGRGFESHGGLLFNDILHVLMRKYGYYYKIWLLHTLKRSYKWPPTHFSACSESKHRSYKILIQ